jgi:ATP-dependent DNA ligase
MSITRRLDELISECSRRGIAIPPSDKKLKRRDYVKILGDDFLKKKYPDGNPPEHLQFVRSMESPMLCFRYDELKPEMKDELWKDNNDWVATDKINGCRCLITYTPQEGIHFYSRNSSVITYLPIDYAETVWLPRFNSTLLEQYGITDFIVDGEILCPESKVNTNISGKLNSGTVTEASLNATSALLAIAPEDSVRIQKDQNVEFKFHLFHILSLNKTPYSECPWEQMDEVLKELINRLKNCGLNVVEVKSARNNKKQFYQDIVKVGGEGIVFKNIKEHYYSTESRYHKAWIKCKRLASETLAADGNGDTIDGFVSGFLPGKEGTINEKRVGTLIFSVFIKKSNGEYYEHEIAHVSGLTDEERNSMTDFDVLGNPILNESWYNRVGEIDGQWVSAKNKRLMHSRLVRFRDDKGKDQCVMEQSTLNRMIIE